MSDPWYADMDDILGECPPLSPEELHRIALRQSYSLTYWLNGDHETRTDALLEESVQLDLAALEQWIESRDSADPFCVEVSE